MISPLRGFNEENIDLLLESYPNRWKYTVPRLERIGKAIRKRKPAYATRDELTEIVSWKRPATGAKFARQNTDARVKSVSQKAFGEESDSERIWELTLLQQVGVPMASAILRFAWPSSYGTVDWRNWYVLSNVTNKVRMRNELFDVPLLRPLRSVQRYSSLGINIDRYLEYLEVIRNLARKYPARMSNNLIASRELTNEFPVRTPAEIDMAVFSYSWYFIVK